jgi:arylsulfatase
LQTRVRRQNDLDNGSLVSVFVSVFVSLEVTPLRVLLLSIAALLLAGPTGCAEPARPDVVLVLFDTLRKDHVGTYGYERDTTPTIDAIAREGLLFENAISQSSWTRPSVASLFTSKYHSYFRPELYQADSGRDRSQLSDTLRDEALTLAEIFASSGYRTASVTTNLNLHATFNLNQGFEQEFYQTGAPADWVVDRALEVIDSEDSEERRPLFLYLHFMEPHAPLMPPEPYASMFPTLDGRPHKKAHTHHFPFSDYATAKKLQSRSFQIFRSHVFALYDGSIRFGDDEIGRLVEHLREKERWDKTVFAFVSDHGESFWDSPLLEKRLGLQSFLTKDRYGVGHGHTLFPEQVSVPLVLRGPGIPPGRANTQVRLIDLAPTLLFLAGVTHPDFEPSGTDLIAAWNAGKLEDRLALSETSTRSARQRSIQDGDFQYVVIDGERELLFDRRDGGFTEVTARNSQVVARLRGQLAAEISAQPAEAPNGDSSEGGPAALDPWMCRGLAELGYVELESCPTAE